MRSFYESGGSGCHFAGLMVALHPLTSTLHLNQFFGVGVWGEEDKNKDAYWEGERGGWGN